MSPLPGLSIAHSINNRGEVAGQRGVSESMPEAAVWRNGMVTGLGKLGGHGSDAFGINELGQVVGTSDKRDLPPRAVLWEDGVMYDLNDLIPPDSGWRLDAAYAINDLGQIVGVGTLPWHEWGFLLTPVPEPSALLSLLCGLGGFAVLRRR